MNKKSIFILLPFLLITPSCKNKVSYLTLIGNDIYNNYTTDSLFLAAKDLSLKPNKLLSSIKGNYRTMLKIVEECPTIFTSTTKYQTSNILDSSKLVIFSFSNKDVFSSYVPQENYAPSQKEKDQELFAYYTDHIFNAFRNNFSSKAMCFNLINLYKYDEDYKTLLAETNSILKDLCTVYEIKYLEIDFMESYIDNGSFTTDGLHKLSAAIKSNYNEKF